MLSSSGASGYSSLSRAKARRPLSGLTTSEPEVGPSDGPECLRAFAFGLLLPLAPPPPPAAPLGTSLSGESLGPCSDSHHQLQCSWKVSVAMDKPNKAPKDTSSKLCPGQRREHKREEEHARSNNQHSKQTPHSSHYPASIVWSACSWALLTVIHDSRESDPRGQEEWQQANHSLVSLIRVPSRGAVAAGLSVLGEAQSKQVQAQVAQSSKAG